MELGGIYEDLTDVSIGDKLIKAQEENRKLLQHVEVLESDISKLCKELTHMKERESNLKKNISELFNTAIMEVNRKQRVINDLQSRIDNLTVHQGRSNSFYKFSCKRNRDDVLQIVQPKRLKIEPSQKDDKQSHLSRNNYGLHKHDNGKRKSAERDLSRRDKKYAQSSIEINRYKYSCTSRHTNSTLKTEQSLVDNKVNSKYSKTELKYEKGIPTQINKVKTETATRRTIVAVEEREINPTISKSNPECIKPNTNSKENLKNPHQKSDKVEAKIKLKLEDSNQKQLAKTIKSNVKSELKSTFEAQQESVPISDTIKYSEVLEKSHHNKQEPPLLKRTNKFEQQLQEINEFDIKNNNEVKVKSIIKAQLEEKKNDIEYKENNSKQQEKNGKIRDSKRKLDESKTISNSTGKIKKSENKTNPKTSNKFCSIDKVQKEIPEVTTKEVATNNVYSVLVEYKNAEKDTKTIPEDLKIREESNSTGKITKIENKTKQKTTTKSCSILTGMDEVRKEMNAPEVTTKDVDTNNVHLVSVECKNVEKDTKTIPKDLKIREESNSTGKIKKSENKTKQKSTTKRCSIVTSIDEVCEEINLPEITTKEVDTNDVHTVLVKCKNAEKDTNTLPGDSVVNNFTVVGKNEQNNPLETEKLTVNMNVMEIVNSSGSIEVVKPLNVEHVQENRQIPQLQVTNNRLHTISSRRRRCVIKIVN